MADIRNSYHRLGGRRNLSVMLLLLVLMGLIAWMNTARKYRICTRTYADKNINNENQVGRYQGTENLLSNSINKDLTNDDCCHWCTSPKNECCMKCSDVSTAREHDLLMALNEGLTFYIMDKYPNSRYKWLETRAWEGNSHIGNRPEQATFYYDWIRSLDLGFDIRHVCEIGMNGGHSAIVFLAALATGQKEKDAHLTMFDLGIFDYSNTARDYIDALYPRRFTFYKGDSKRVLPEWTILDSTEKCDVFSIDGDHSYNGAIADIINAAKATRTGGMVILDDVNPGSPTRAAFDSAVTEGTLGNPKCIEDVPTLVGHNNRFDEDKARRIKSSWCFATVL